MMIRYYLFIYAIFSHHHSFSRCHLVNVDARRRIILPPRSFHAIIIIATPLIMPSLPLLADASFISPFIFTARYPHGAPPVIRRAALDYAAACIKITLFFHVYREYIHASATITRWLPLRAIFLPSSRSHAYAIERFHMMRTWRG